MPGINPLDMSDDDFSKLSSPSSIPNDAPSGNSSSVGSAETTETAAENTDKVVETESATSVEVSDKSAINAGGEKSESEKNSDSSEKTGKNPADNATAESTEKPVEQIDAAKATESADKVADKPDAETATAPDYEGFYKKVLAPFKANGKMIELKTPEEAIALMQMGANYTRKMQEIQPYKKMVMMLQKNGLMDEDRLAFLIDLSNKNPDAVKKLVKESGIDPLDIDTNSESTYQAGNHAVSDEEVAFRTAMEDLTSTPEGRGTLQVIHTSWDQASKEVLWKSPELMQTMHAQREAGLYQMIVDEIERKQILGQLPKNVAFLEAYRTVGDQLMAAGKFNKQVEKPKVGSMIDTRPQVTKPAVQNGSKASAAATNRTTPKAAKPIVNPLAMSDDEFLSQWANRL